MKVSIDELQRECAHKHEHEREREHEHEHWPLPQEAQGRLGVKEEKM